MIRFNRKALLSVLITAAVLTALVSSCDMDGDDPPESGGTEYLSAIAKVDYNGAKRAVFIDFSSESVVRELPMDFFDLAIDSSGNAIANSGSYGSGVTVLKTDKTDITEDLSSYAAGWDASGAGLGTGQYTFKAGTNLYDSQQTAVNPFAGGIKGTPMQQGDFGKVYIIKTKYVAGDGNWYKVIFDIFGMTAMTPSATAGYKITVVKGLEGGENEKTTLEDSLTGIRDGFGWIWFKLDGDAGPRALNTATALNTGAPDIPKAADWDLLCIRTNELQTTDGTTIEAQMPVATRSSILLNTYKSVKAYTAAGKSIDQVLNLDGLTEAGDVDAIGYGWYSMAGMPPTFAVSTNTYVVKTVEGNYAKFQPGSFYGPNNESFYMQFRYVYGDDSGTFNQ
jgi:hypothetical protein